jgi:integrase
MTGSSPFPAPKAYRMTPAPPQMETSPSPDRSAAPASDVSRFASNRTPLSTGVKGPRQTPKLVTPLTDDDLRALIATCVTPTHRAGEPLHHRRDEAIIRLMFETGIRIGETIALQVDDVDLDAGRVTVRRGKGGRGRVIPIGATTSAALRAYLSLRAHHPRGDSPELWLGERGTQLGHDGLSRALRRRAQLAGIAGFRPTSSATPQPTAGSPREAPSPG